MLTLDAGEARAGKPTNQGDSGSPAKPVIFQQPVTAQGRKVYVTCLGDIRENRVINVSENRTAWCGLQGRQR